MSQTSRIPHHLAPYIDNVPKDSLILLTGTLSNSVNWLVVRYLCSAFSNGSSAHQNDTGVVLVSWMRDWEFWRTEARRSGGLDLAALAQQKRLVFVDGLNASSPTRQAASPSQRGTTLPSPGPTRTPGPLPGRGPPSAPSVATPPPPPPSALPSDPNLQHLASLDPAKIQHTIETALASLSTSSVLLILDSLDLLLALKPTPAASALHSLLLTLRLHPSVHTTLLSLASDIPTPPPIKTPLETESSAFLVGVAHTADLIVSARGLDTGAAGDVGGVLRVTVPKTGLNDEREKQGRHEEWREQELLYLVKTDGSAKVWERGAGVGDG